MAAASAERALTADRLKSLLKDLDPLETIDDDVQSILLDMADDFIDQVAIGAAALARHRQSNTIEPKDVLMTLTKNWNIQVPGFENAVDARPIRSSATAALATHRQRVLAVRREQTARDLAAAQAAAASSTTTTTTAAELVKPKIQFSAPTASLLNDPRLRASRPSRKRRKDLTSGALHKVTEVLKAAGSGNLSLGMLHSHRSTLQLLNASKKPSVIAPPVSQSESSTQSAAPADSSAQDDPMPDDEEYGDEEEEEEDDNAGSSIFDQF